MPQMLRNPRSPGGHLYVPPHTLSRSPHINSEFTRLESERKAHEGRLEQLARLQAFRDEVAEDLAAHHAAAMDAAHRWDREALKREAGEILELERCSGLIDERYAEWLAYPEAQETGDDA